MTCLSVLAPMQAQTDSVMPFAPLQLVRENRQYDCYNEIPAGNYSGIAYLGDDRYAVVDDKSAGDGFCIFRIKLSEKDGHVKRIRQESFHSSGLSNRDGEGIVYVPSSGTLFISGEKHNDVLEYRLDGSRTNRELHVPDTLKKANPNYGLEALAYNANTRLFWTTTEGPLPGEIAHRLQSFGEDMQPKEQFPYQMDKPIREDKSDRHVHGISALTALDDGTLLVLERELFANLSSFEAWVNCKIYQVKPGHPAKHLLHEWRTRFSILNNTFANYEGMCLGPMLADGTQVLVLISDSQKQYYGVLSDYLKTLLVVQPKNHQ